MKILKVIFLILVLVGMSISSYLTYVHFSTSSIYCGTEQTLSYLNSNNNPNSCNGVLQSKYSKIFGIPTAILGIIFYITTFIIFLSYIYKKYFINYFLYKYTEKILVFITFIGVLFSIYFTLLQFLVIKSFCTYCFTSASITIILFLISLYYFKKK